MHHRHQTPALLQSRSIWKVSSIKNDRPSFRPAPLLTHLSGAGTPIASFGMLNDGGDVASSTSTMGRSLARGEQGGWLTSSGLSGWHLSPGDSRVFGQRGPYRIRMDKRGNSSYFTFLLVLFHRRPSWTSQLLVSGQLADRRRLLVQDYQESSSALSESLRSPGQQD